MALLTPGYLITIARNAVDSGRSAESGSLFNAKMREARYMSRRLLAGISIFLEIRAKTDDLLSFYVIYDLPSIAPAPLPRIDFKHVNSEIITGVFHVSRLFVTEIFAIKQWIQL